MSVHRPAPSSDAPDAEGVHGQDALAARWAPRLVRFRWWIVAAWLVAIVLGGLAARGLDNLVLEEDGARNSGSYRAHAALKRYFDANPRTEFGVIFERAPEASQASVEGYRARILETLRANPAVQRTDRIALPDAPPTLGLERVRLDPSITPPAAKDVAMALQERLAALTPPPGVQAHLMGQPVIVGELNALNGREVQRIERISVVISLVVLVVVFGSLTAAVLPVFIGLASITATLGAIAALGGAIPVMSMTRLVTSIIALGIGIDYALFLVSRYREEREAGLDVTPALARTLSRTGEALWFSGLIMIIAVAALAIPDYSGTRAIAGAVALVVGTTLAASFTLLPALLALCDRFLDWPKALSRLKPKREGVRWEGLIRHVVRRHRAWLALSVLAMALLIAPLGHMRFWEPGPTLLPRELGSRQAYDALARAGLTGELNSLYLVAHQAPGAAALPQASVQALWALTAQLKADPRIRRVESPLDPRGTWREADARRFVAQWDHPVLRWVLLPRLKQAVHVGEEGTTLVLRVVPKDGMASPATPALIEDLNRRILPGSAHAPGLSWDLGGEAPRRADFTAEMYGKAPLVLLVLLGAIYVVLLRYFRSVFLPVKAIAMNMLPVLASCGALVLVLQDGWGASLLGIEAPGAVMAMTPLMLFCIVFGLGMDYEVLILSRIQEAHRRGLPDEEAIVEGMGRTGGLVTGAALIMLSVFAPNMASALINAKELGLSLTVAVLVDATLVRLILVPTFMRAMGRWNWYHPTQSPSPRRGRDSSPHAEGGQRPDEGGSQRN